MLKIFTKLFKSKREVIDLEDGEKIDASKITTGEIKKLIIKDMEVDDEKYI